MIVHMDSDDSMFLLLITTIIATINIFHMHRYVHMNK